MLMNFRKKDFLKRLVFKKKPHRVELTNSTTIVKTSLNDSSKKYIISDKYLTFKQLAFILKVKRYAENCGNELQPYQSSDINYFKFYDFGETEFFDVVEVDVNKAYWNIAYDVGYISDSIYKEGLCIDKKTRLIALGSLATVKTVYDYADHDQDGIFSYKKVDVIENKLTRSYFFHVAKILDNYMNLASDHVAPGSLLFYWVDAFFIKSKNSNELVNFLNLQKLGVKFKPVRKIKILHKKYNSTIIVYEEKKRNGKVYLSPKIFYKPNGNTSKYIINKHNQILSKLFKK